MAHNGLFRVNAALVTEIMHGAGRSRLMVNNGTIFITIESVGAQLPADLNLRPGAEVDLFVQFDK